MPLWRAFPAAAAVRANTAVRGVTDVAKGEDDWMDFSDDDFWFLDEMYEGRLETPEFLPDFERELLDREGLEGSNKK